MPVFGNLWYEMSGNTVNVKQHGTLILLIRRQRFGFKFTSLDFKSVETDSDGK